MSDSLDIDIERLISSVQSRVVLWDKTSEKYKDKFKTLEAWKAVCTEIIDGYEHFNDSKKNDIGKHVLKKWTQVRDSYRKSLGKTKAAKKSGSGVVKVKAYVHSSHLQFLDKIFQESNTEDTLSQNIDDCGDEDSMVETGEDPVEQVPSTSSDGAAEKPESSFKKPVTKKRKMDPVELEMISALREPVNRHLLFFKGLLPSLEDFNEFDTIDFQMEVLKIVRNIRERKCQQQTQLVHNRHPPLCSGSVYQLQTEPQISAGQYHEKTAHYLSSPNPSCSSYSGSDDSSDFF
ncbi:uncharacterized protein LOC123681599 [Harmonia axyridis]|uniref:uncharacterized protein LOC123681599 n=1 Tax=Harmonia axyridis TaxID=115357 RepID=UPI001E276ED8|nr:uncharacterized protein LOC123681599 [Harmonia axyridis]